MTGHAERQCRAADRLALGEVGSAQLSSALVRVFFLATMLMALTPWAAPAAVPASPSKPLADSPRPPVDDLPATPPPPFFEEPEASTGIPTDLPGPVPSSEETPTDPAPLTPDQRCAAARMDVEAMGLYLPDTFTFACPAYAAGSHGITYASRNGNPGSVAISDLSLGRSDPDLRGIIAHEFAHAWDFHERKQTTECHADEVAGSYGFHNPFAVC